MRHAGFIAIATMALVSGILSGCGGTGSGDSSVDGQRDGLPELASGRVSVQIAWPERPKDAELERIPTASESIKIEAVHLDSEAREDRTVVVNRPETRAEISDVPSGDWLVVATAHPQANGQGIAQGVSEDQIRVLPETTTECRLRLESTIHHLELRPNPLRLSETQPGGTMTVTARDISGNAVIVPDSTDTFTWGIYGDAPLPARFAGVCGISSCEIVAIRGGGEATVWVRENETGNELRDTATVIVGPEGPDYYRIDDISDVHLCGNGNAVTIASGNEISGRFDCRLYDSGIYALDDHTVALGLRDASGNWIGAEPKVVMSLIGKEGSPEGTFYNDSRFENTNALPTDGVMPGEYTLWVHDTANITATSEAVEEFKNTTPTTETDTDKIIGTVTIARTSTDRIAFHEIDYASGQVDIVLINTEGDRQRIKLTDDSAIDMDPTWSPDGTKVAFRRGTGSDADIYIANADGSGSPTRLASVPGWDGNPAWSPDGSQIAVASLREGNTDIWIWEADGSQGELALDLYYPCDNPAWSPDGSKIAFDFQYSGDDWDIAYVDVSTKEITWLFTTTEGEREPAWDPSGSNIAFRRGKRGNGTNICIGPADGTGDWQYWTNSSAEDKEPVFSPRGTLAFSSDRAEYGVFDIWLSDDIDDPPSRLTDGSESSESPSWWVP